MTGGKEGSTYANICLGCMADKGTDSVCRKCGFDESKTEVHQLRIKPRSILKNQYLIGKVLGQGGFGITYLGLDLLLHKKVAIKEFLPSMLATRDSDKTSVVPYSGSQEQFFHQGLQSFIFEARSVANFSRHINIVNVNNYFEANNTGYMVMDYLEGEPVSKLIVKKGGKLALSEAFSILFPILEALGEVHKMDIYHRDISPQNIIVTRNNVPVLIDFGAARQIVGEQSYSLDVVLKHGYSPLEQYTSKGKIGPWSDVYACGATLYHMITGKLPPPAIDRVYNDELIQPSDIEGLNISEELNDTILTSLAVRAADRFQSVDEFKEALEKKGYVGYRRLLESFLKDQGVTIENRIILDAFILDHRLNQDDAKLIEETLREELNQPRLDWAAEFRENYERYAREHQGGIQQSMEEKFHETYVDAKRILHAKASEIVRDIREPKTTPGEITEFAEPKTVPGARMEPPEDMAPQAKTVELPEAKAAPGKVVELPEVKAAPWKKGLFVKAAAAACIVIAIAVFFVVKPKNGVEPDPMKKSTSTVIPPSSDKSGFINVWSKPPAEIYVNGRFVGLSPLSRIEVPSGDVTIRLVSKEHNIDETYTEHVEPASSHASN